MPLQDKPAPQKKRILRCALDDNVGVGSRAIVVQLPRRIDRRGHDISCPYGWASKRLRDRWMPNILLSGI